MRPVQPLRLESAQHLQQQKIVGKHDAATEIKVPGLLPQFLPQPNSPDFAADEVSSIL